jgi:hydroxypyruvate isomerase
VQLDAMGYDGWVGCEYKPKAGTESGLGWRAAHGV